MDQIFPKRLFHIRISLGTEFQFKQIILIFWNKFDHKGYFQSKASKMNLAIGFCIFELVYIPNFSLK